MTEIKKIALACFIGGAICSLVALIFIATYWWLGLIAGLFGGYLGYDFREVLIAIPKAFSIAKKGSGKVFKSIWEQTNKFFKAIYKWLNSPHPFLCPALILSFIPTSFLWIYFPLYTGESMIEILFALLVLITLISLSTPVFIGIVFLLAFIGARFVEKSFWRPLVLCTDKEEEDHEIFRLGQEGYEEKTLSDKNVFRWMIKGFGITLSFFIWKLWKYLAVAIGISFWEFFCIIGRFLWNMLKIVHSRKRVLCAIDGTLGGLVSFIWFSPNMNMTTFGQILIVLFGGILGATFGILNFEVVSKKILKVA